MTHIQPVGFVDTFAFVASLFARYAQFEDIAIRQSSVGSPHKDTRTIFLRVPKNPSAETWFEDVPHEPTEYLVQWPAAQDLILSVADALQIVPSEFGKLMVVELRGGGTIAWHTDEGAYAKAHSRYHLPLITNPKALMLSGGEQAHLPVGVLFKFDTSVLHSAVNLGPTARVHLIVDVRR